MSKSSTPMQRLMEHLKEQVRCKLCDQNIRNTIVWNLTPYNVRGMY